MEIVKELNKLHQQTTGENLYKIIIKKGDEQAVIGESSNPFEVDALVKKAKKIINNMKGE